MPAVQRKGEAMSPDEKAALEGFAKTVGAKILGELKNTARATWAHLDEQTRVDFADVSRDVAMLMGKAMLGQDVKQELALAESSVADIGSVEDIYAKREFWNAVKRVAGSVGEVVIAFAEGAAKRVI
jgi:hypothetical protein